MRNGLGGGRLFGAHAGKQWRRQVSLAEAGGNGYDHLAAIFGPGSQSRSDRNIGTRADAAEDALFAGQTPRPTECIVIAHRFHTAKQARIEVLGDETGTDALDLVSPGEPPEMTGESTGSMAMAWNLRFFVRM